MGTVDIETRRVAGEEVKITFAPRSGTFYATFDQVEYSGKTLDEIGEKLKKAEKRAKTFKPIDVTLLGAAWEKSKGESWRGASREPELQTGTEYRGKSLDVLLRGRNDRTRQALITVHDQKVALETYRNSTTQFVRRLSAGEHRQYRELCATLAAAESDLKTWIEERAIDVDALVKGGEE